MDIDKEKLKGLLWAEAASYRADCADWKRNTEALDDFLGEKTVGEVALELLAENDELKNVCAAYGRVNTALLAENDALRKERDARHPFKPFHEPSIGYTGCVICGAYTDHGGLPCPNTRATTYAAMGKGEHS